MQSELPDCMAVCLTESMVCLDGRSILTAFGARGIKCLFTFQASQLGLSDRPTKPHNHHLNLVGPDDYEAWWVCLIAPAD
jgi:hypothetical protein